jgi:hypothetical protein
MITGTLTRRQYTVIVLHPMSAPLLDHVERAAPVEAAGYVAVVLLWLAGVMVVVYRKLRTSR